MTRVRRATTRTRTMFTITIVAVAALVVGVTSIGSSTATATASPETVPSFGGQLRPLLEAHMRQRATPGAIVFVDVPGKGQLDHLARDR